MTKIVISLSVENAQPAQVPRGNCGTCARNVGGQCELHAQLWRGKLDVAHASRMREVHRKCPLDVWAYQPILEN